MDTTLTLPAEDLEARTAREARESELCTAESAECTCPDFCERDHEND